MIFIQTTIQLIQDHVKQIDYEEDFKYLLENSQKPILAFLFDDKNYYEIQEQIEEFNKGYNHYGYMVDPIKIDCTNILLEYVCKFFQQEQLNTLYLYSNNQIYQFRKPKEYNEKEKNRLLDIQQKKKQNGEDVEEDITTNKESIKQFIQKYVRSSIMELQFKADIQQLVQLDQPIILMWTSRMKSSQVHYKISQMFQKYQIYVVIYFNQKLVTGIKQLENYDFEEEGYGLLLCNNGFQQECKQYKGDNILEDILYFIEQNQ